MCYARAIEEKLEKNSNKEIVAELEALVTQNRKDDNVIDKITVLISVLARRGQIEILTDLKATFRHEIDYAAQHIASQETVEIEALNLLIGLGATLNNAAIAATVAGHTIIVENLLDRGANNLNQIIQHAAQAGRFALMAKIIASQSDDTVRYMLLTPAVHGAFQGGRIKNEEDACRIMLHLPGKLREHFAHTVDATELFVVPDIGVIKRSDVIPFKLTSLIPRVDAIVPKARSKNITIIQSYIWHIAPEIQLLLALSRAETARFPHPLWLLIALFIAPEFVPNAEVVLGDMINLEQKMSLDLRKLDLSTDLACYLCDKHSFFRTKKTEKFKTACENAASEDELTRLIDAQLASLKAHENGQYFNLIKKHAKR